MNANTNRPNSPNETSPSSLSNLRKSKSSLERSSQFDLASIPKIFLSPNLDLSRRDNFETVFPFTKDGLLNVGGNVVVHVKLLQEKVSKRKKIILYRSVRLFSVPEINSPGFQLE